MQDGKENSTGFVKNIWNTVHDWWVSYDRKLWTARIFVYGILLLLVVSVGVIVFTHCNLFHTDAGSARYMLSALVQSQAAIVAIVITLTLIAVQLTASAYSPRVIDIFKKNPDMWLLLGCYGVSIFFGFIVLKLVVGKEGENVSQSAIWSLGRFSVSFESCVSLAYWLGAFTFVALFPYMLNIIGLLKSEKIIKRLAVKITRDKFLNSKEDPIQPIMDIIHGSIMKYDLETTRVGLRVVTERMIEIIDSNREDEISKRFCKHLQQVGRLAISRDDVESTVEVIKNLEMFGKSTAEKEHEDATSLTATFIGDVGLTALDAQYLSRLGKFKTEEGYVDATCQATMSLGAVGKAAVEKGLGKATTQVVMSLNEVGKSAAEKGLDDATWEAVKFLGEVGVAAAKQDLNEVTSQAVTSLDEVGKSAAEKRLDGATKKAAIGLGKVGEAAAKKGLEKATKWAAICLEEFGVRAAEKRLKGATRRVAESLEKVGKAAEKQGLEDATTRAATSLIVVGITYVENSLEDVTEKAAKSFGLEDTAERLARSLAELTISSEEIVKTAIQNYESILEEKNNDYFKKFMKIYKQKLEELRVKRRT